MTVKTGGEYLASLRDDREVWMQGERIEDVTKDEMMDRVTALLNQA